MASKSIPVYVEVGQKRVFASALDWPGWCRTAKTEVAALEALEAYAPRYAVVAERAGMPFPSGFTLDVVERLPGGATTDFGAPEKTATAETTKVTPAAARRLATLVTAAWAVFDEVVAVTPAELRKGPRGGGRDRDKMTDHVLGAESAYARMIGVKLKQPELGDLEAIDALRTAIAAVLATPSDGSPVREKGWTTRYAARRIAWHVLDHVWEMQDRAEPE